MVEYFLRFWEFRARNLLIEVFKSIYPYETHYIQLLNYIYIYIFFFFSFKVLSSAFNSKLATFSNAPSSPF